MRKDPEVVFLRDGETLRDRIFDGDVLVFVHQGPEHATEIGTLLHSLPKHRKRAAWLKRLLQFWPLHQPPQVTVQNCAFGGSLSFGTAIGCSVRVAVIGNHTNKTTTGWAVRGELEWP